VNSSRDERIFSAVVIGGIAFAANVVLATAPQFAASRSTLATAWLSGIVITVAAFYGGRRLSSARARHPLATKSALLVALAIPFVLSIIDVEIADALFAACAGGLTAIAGFAVWRVGAAGTT
jgi:hypothetical protein